MNSIPGKDISVVVQGPIFGSKNDPYEKRFTLRCLESIRKHLPQAEIILSTWKGSSIDDLTYDILVENDDPGPLHLEHNKLVTNTNRQILSTKNGIAKASGKYILKLRSDTLLEGNDFLQYFDSFQARCDEWKVFEKRILSCTIVSQNPRKSPIPFNPSDWFHFGLNEDVKNLWDIPLIPLPETTIKNDNGRNKAYVLYLDIHQYTPEQYIWINCLRKHGEIKLDNSLDATEETIELTELTIVNNLVLLEPEQLEIKSLKYDEEHTLHMHYSHSEWLELYQKYYLKSYFPCFNKNIYEYSALYPSHNCPQDNNLSKLFANVLAISSNSEWNKTDVYDERIRPILNSPSGQFLRILACLTKELKPNLTIEFETGDGITSLCIAQSLPHSSTLLTINTTGWEKDKISHLQPEDLDSKKIWQCSIDISLMKNLAELDPVITKADFIVLNITNGLLVKKIFDYLSNFNFNGKLMILINHIKLWNMQPVWNEIHKPKIDISSFGLWSGTGLVQWQAE